MVESRIGSICRLCRGVTAKRSPALRYCSFAVLLFLTPQVSQAREELGADVITSQLSRELANARLKSVVVADFLSSNGESSTLGWYLADQLSESWLAKKEKFRVVDRSELKDTKISAEEVNSSEAVRRLGGIWGANAIVTGTVETLPDRYILSVSLRRAADNIVLTTASIPVSRSRILDLLAPQGVSGTASDALRAGANGAGIPECVYCPNPSYTDRARKVKTNGAVILTLVISSEGRVDRVDVAKRLGYGLTEMAIAAVIDWRLKPAKKDGQAVPVMTPVEVTFKLY